MGCWIEFLSPLLYKIRAKYHFNKNENDMIVYLGIFELLGALPHSTIYTP